ncbi:MAG: hypothetical protein IT242_04685 [Bacteroidia bacterium]|nr:hypothetical protein [Bacteroidia bacterium]
MIRYLKHTEINRKAWDACIQQSQNSYVYAYSWYLDIVSPGWDALIGNDYAAVFPLTHRSRFGYRYLFQPAFTQQLGLFYTGENYKDSILDFIGTIPPEFRLIQIQLNDGNPFTGNLPPEFTCNKRRTYHLMLNRDIETIRKAYSENLRRNIKKAGREGLTTPERVDVTDIIRLFRNNRGKRLSHLGEREYGMLQKLLDGAAQKNLILSSGIYTPEKELCAGAVFLKSREKYIFFFSAVNETGRSKGAISFLIDYFISIHAGESVLLDFEGSMDPNLARYYSSFGSQEVVYLQLKRNTLPAAIRWLKK